MCPPWIAGASRLHCEIKGEINKSHHSGVYMYNAAARFSAHTGRVTHSHTLTQINKQADRE